MSFLGGLFGERPDPLHDHASNLVQAAHAHAVANFTPLLERFPILRQVDTEQWDFVLTVAGVFIAATRLNNLRLGNAREDQLMEVVAERLNEWSPDGIRGFEDCKQLFEREFDRLEDAGHDPQFVAADAVGIWIVLNLLGRHPKMDEECGLVRSTGAMTTHAFFDWWDK